MERAVFFFSPTIFGFMESRLRGYRPKAFPFHNHLTPLGVRKQPHDGPMDMRRDFRDGFTFI